MSLMIFFSWGVIPGEDVLDGDKGREVSLVVDKPSVQLLRPLTRRAGGANDSLSLLEPRVALQEKTGHC